MRLLFIRAAVGLGLLAVWATLTASAQISDDVLDSQADTPKNQDGAETPKDPETYLQLSAEALKAGRLDEARELLDRGRELLPAFYISRQAVVEWQYAVGMIQLASERFKQGTRDGISLKEVVEHLTEARNLLRKAEELDPKVLGWAAHMALLYQVSGERWRGNVGQWMEYALAFRPDDAATQGIASRWHLESGALEDAKRHAVAALEIDSESSPALVQRGLVSLMEKRYEAAEAYFHEAINQSPADFAPTDNLALALCEQTEPEMQRRALQYAARNAKAFADTDH